MLSNREKSNLIVNQKLFFILGVPILFTLILQFREKSMLMRNAVLERSLKECLLMAEYPSQLLR